MLARLVPCFSLVVSIIGSFMVTLLAFVLPPLMHLELVVRGRGAAEAEPGDEEPGLAAARDVVRGRRPPRALDVAQDIACAALGAVVCLAATALTVRNAILNPSC